MELCSKYRSDGWYEQLGGDAGPLADAIDRIVYDAYIINIESLDPTKDMFQCVRYMDWLSP